MFTAHMLIGGELTDEGHSGFVDVVEPATEQRLGRAAVASKQDADAAVAAAKVAQPAWAALNLSERARLLRAVATAIRDRAEEIARLETRDTGNLYGPMLNDAKSAANKIDYFAGLAPATLGASYPATAGHLHFSTREPFGVVARIVAFNHPFMFLASRMAAPLIVGNTVVLKTPDQAPLSGGILAEICKDILPPGVVNILHGEGAVAGDALVTHPDVKRIGFIGSVPTAQRISARAAETGIKAVSHELGGKNMMVVLPDADLDLATKLAVEGMNFQWQGQSCGSTSLLCLHDAIYDRLIERVRAEIAKIRVGDPFDPASGMGPLISAAHHAKVTGAIEAGKASGATLLAGGGRPQGPGFEKGYWLEPTLFGDVDPESALACEEIFGPVLSALRWRDPAEITRIDDRSPLGLTCAVVGRDIDTALGFARRINTGYVYVNCVGPHYPGVPYGGMKNSGVGREEGIEELLGYTEIKSYNIAVPRLGGNGA